MLGERRERPASRPRSTDYGGGLRSGRDKTADSLWGQSASQRAAVTSSRDQPASAALFSRHSYDAERERKRQLISKMVRAAGSRRPCCRTRTRTCTCPRVSVALRC
jgi:hypothetical protein